MIKPLVGLDYLIKKIVINFYNIAGLKLINVYFLLITPAARLFVCIT